MTSSDFESTRYGRVGTALNTIGIYVIFSVVRIFVPRENENKLAESFDKNVF